MCRFSTEAVSGSYSWSPGSISGQGRGENGLVNVRSQETQHSRALTSSDSTSWSGKEREEEARATSNGSTSSPSPLPAPSPASIRLSMAGGCRTQRPPAQLRRRRLLLGWGRLEHSASSSSSPTSSHSSDSSSHAPHHLQPVHVRTCPLLVMRRWEKGKSDQIEHL